MINFRKFSILLLIFTLLIAGCSQNIQQKQDLEWRQKTINYIISNQTSEGKFTEVKINYQDLPRDLYLTYYFISTFDLIGKEYEFSRADNRFVRDSLKSDSSIGIDNLYYGLMLAKDAKQNILESDLKFCREQLLKYRSENGLFLESLDAETSSPKEQLLGTYYALQIEKLVDANISKKTKDSLNDLWATFLKNPHSWSAQETCLLVLDLYSVDSTIDFSPAITSLQESLRTDFESITENSLEGLLRIYEVVDLLQIDTPLPQNIATQLLQSENENGFFFSEASPNLLSTYFVVKLFKMNNLQIPNASTLRKSILKYHSPQGGFVAPEIVTTDTLGDIPYAVLALDLLEYPIGDKTFLVQASKKVLDSYLKGTSNYSEVFMVLKMLSVLDEPIYQKQELLKESKTRLLQSGPALRITILRIIALLEQDDTASLSQNCLNNDLQQLLNRTHISDTNLVDIYLLTEIQKYTSLKPTLPETAQKHLLTYLNDSSINSIEHLFVLTRTFNNLSLKVPKSRLRSQLLKFRCRSGGYSPNVESSGFPSMQATYLGLSIEKELL